MQFPVIGMQFQGSAESGMITLERFLGAGAFGFVFAGRGEDQRQYALKFPQVATMTGEVALAAFMNEASAATKIRHKNVLSVLLVSEADDQQMPYLVLEYADGGTLQDKIHAAGTATIPVEVVLDWSQQLVDGIEAINATMLHRDIKPDNVLFVGQVPKFADFGLSKIVDARTRTQTFKGGQHVLYMPPEGWLGDRNEIQIDMYAMGILLFQIATLQFPYTLPSYPTDIGSISEMHLKQVPRRISAIRSDMPGRFSDIVFKLMEKRPQDRYASWSEVRTAMNALAAGSQPATAARPEMRQLLEAMQGKHDEVARATAVQNEAAARRKAERIADQYSRDRITERLLVLVQDFNAESESHKIQVVEHSGDKVSMRIPYGRNAELEFFEFPKITLREATVRFGGAFADADGCGFNLLLLRTADDDVYGTWKVCRIVPGVFGRHRLKSGCSSLALGPSRMGDVQKALTMTHTLAGTLVDDIEGEFLKQLREFAGPIGD